MLSSLPLVSRYPFKPQYPIGRQLEIEQISQVFANDGDLMLTGVAGSGRRTLIRHGAQVAGARVVEIDCLRATTSERFLTLLADALLHAFLEVSERQLIETWAQKRAIEFFYAGESVSLSWDISQTPAWTVFQDLLTLPQWLAEQLKSRVVFVFQNFPHIRTWDRTNAWEAYLRQEIQRQSRVSYVIIATIPESWAQSCHLQVMTLTPLSRPLLSDWVTQVMAEQGVQFKPEALDLYLNIAQGHMGTASALARRIWTDLHLPPLTSDSALAPKAIEVSVVEYSTQTLIEDLSTTFESLLLLLPPIQAKVLESLVIDPTDRPHAREYLQKHQLSKGGGLQGALASLEQKGLLYGPKDGYRLALPLFRLWLKQRLE
ncbi:MAG TPA: ATP-binding protein [Stenomitos sp.]